MALKILYFANLRESIGSGSESVDLPAGVVTLTQLRDFLAGRGERYAILLTAKNLRAAVNQKMAGMDSAIADGDEVAFFPPVTGG
jgi:molybdopterin synthase sulfur carrier subunit